MCVHVYLLIYTFFFVHVGIKVDDKDSSASIWMLTTARSVSRAGTGRTNQRTTARDVHKRLRDEADAKHRNRNQEDETITKSRR